jgi:hypothetical protein
MIEDIEDDRPAIDYQAASSGRPFPWVPPAPEVPVPIRSEPGFGVVRYGFRRVPVMSVQLWQGDNLVLTRRVTSDPCTVDVPAPGPDEEPYRVTIQWVGSAAERVPGGGNR